MIFKVDSIRVSRNVWKGEEVKVEHLVSGKVDTIRMSRNEWKGGQSRELNSTRMS